MRSETVIGGCKDGWQYIPQLLLKLVLKNEFIFDYLKYETLRAELNYGVLKEKSQMLWDEQF